MLHWTRPQGHQHEGILIGAGAGAEKQIVSASCAPGFTESSNEEASEMGDQPTEAPPLLQASVRLQQLLERLGDGSALMNVKAAA